MRFSSMRFILALLVLINVGAAGALEPARIRTPPQTVTLEIQQMDCPMCKITIGRALKKVEGVTEATVDIDSKTATVTFDPKKTTVEALTQATTNVGYPSSMKR